MRAPLLCSLLLLVLPSVTWAGGHGATRHDAAQKYLEVLPDDPPPVPRGADGAIDWAAL